MAIKSIKKNYALNLFQQILNLLTPLITTPYISRVLGAEGIGIYSYTNSIVFYFTLFATLGTVTYGQREISYVQDNREKRSEVFWNTEIRCVITTTCCLIAYIFFVLIQKQNRLIYIILAISIIDVALNVSWVFTGMEEFGKIVKRNVIVKIISIAFIFIFVRSANDLALYVLGMTLVMTVGHLSLWPFLPQIINRPQWKKIHPFKDFSVVLSLFIPTIAISIYTVLDKTMIGIITGNAAENGFYDQAIKISRIALTVVTALGVVMVPRIGFLFEKKDILLIRQYMYRSYRFVWLLGIPLCFGIVGIASNFVPWFFGPGFDPVVPILCTLSFLILTIGISNVTGIQYLIPTKRQNTFTKTVLLGALINFLLNLLLISDYGAIGAAIASVSAEGFIAIIQLIIVRKELSFFTIIKQSVKYFIAGLLMLAGLVFENRLLQPSILNTMLLVMTGCLVYTGTLIALRDEFFLKNVTDALLKIMQKLNRK